MIYEKNYERLNKLERKDFYTIEFESAILLLEVMKELNYSKYCFECNHFFNKTEKTENRRSVCPFCYSQYYRSKKTYENMILKKYRELPMYRQFKKDVRNRIKKLDVYQEYKKIWKEKKKIVVKKGIKNGLILDGLLLLAIITFGVSLIPTIFLLIKDIIDKKNKRGYYRYD